VQIVSAIVINVELFPNGRPKDLQIYRIVLAPSLADRRNNTDRIDTCAKVVLEREPAKTSFKNLSTSRLGEAVEEARRIELLVDRMLKGEVQITKVR